MRMKPRACVGALFLTALVSGCVTSVHPLYTEDDLVFMPELLGTWSERGESESWTFLRDGEDAYRLEHRDSQGRVGTFDAHLVRIGGGLYLDLYPSRVSEELNELYLCQLRATHMIFRVGSVEPELELALLDEEWLEDLLEEEPDAIAHEVTGEGILLTASTEELQAFVLTHADEGFGEPGVFRRRPMVPGGEPVPAPPPLPGAS